MKLPDHDFFQLRYIAAAAAVLAAFFVMLAGGNLLRNFAEARESAETASYSSSEETESGETDTAEEEEQPDGEEDTASSAEAADAEAADADTADAEAADAPDAEELTLLGRTARNAAEEADRVIRESTERTITISAAGDCTLGTDEGFNYDSSFNAMYSEMDDPSWFLANVQQYFANDDLTIVNFEGVLTTGGERKDKTFCFKGKPEYTSVLTEGSVEAVNLANNHSFDYGSDSYYEMKDILKEAGIEMFGYDNSIVLDVGGIKVGLTGTYELPDGLDAKPKVLAEIEKVKAEGAQLIICSFHWGDEGERTQNSIQTELAHAAIDAGADLVLGHHPHVLQPMEVYNGKYIFYSLGNFCFGGNSDPSDKDTAVIQQTFHFTGGTLDEAEEAVVIPCRISSTSDYNNYQPTPYEEGSEQYERVLSKLGIGE